MPQASFIDLAVVSEGVVKRLYRCQLSSVRMGPRKRPLERRTPSADDPRQVGQRGDGDTHAGSMQLLDLSDMEGDLVDINALLEDDDVSVVDVVAA